MIPFVDTWWFQTMGWVGSGLVVASLIVPNAFKFRWLNFAGSLLSTFWNLAAGIWPFVAMNGAIAIINIYWLRRLYREKNKVEPDEVLAEPIPSNTEPLLSEGT